MLKFATYASGSSGNLYAISDGESRLMIECGLRWPAVQKAFDFKLSNVSGALFSHHHADHTKSVKNLMKIGVDVYMTEETAEALRLTGHRLNIVKPGVQFKIDDWTLLPFETEHDCPGTVGYLVANKAGEKLLFATDSFYLKYKFKGLKIIAIECNYDSEILNDNVANGTVNRALKNRLIKSHFSLENVKEFLRANDLSRVTEIYLLHLSDKNSDERKFKEEIQRLTGKAVYVA